MVNSFFLQKSCFLHVSRCSRLQWPRDSRETSPMDSSRNDSASANHLAFTSLKKLLKEQNSVLICSSLSVFVAMPINPHIRICLSSLHSPAASISRHSSKLNPNLVSSRAMCSCSRQLTVFPALAACLFTSANSL